MLTEYIPVSGVKSRKEICKMKKILAVLLALTTVFALCACGAAPTAAEAPAEVPAVKEPTPEEYAAWAEANGYVLNPEENGYAKLSPELATAATVSGVGGINYGCIDWSEDLQKAAVREWLKGGMIHADPAHAQDDSGYNYRNMMQMATSCNNIPNNTNLELVLDIDSLHLLGVSEAGTSKTIEFAENPNVCVAWSRQISVSEEEAGYNYYGSYGLSFYGTVKIYSAADLETEEGQNALLNLSDRYYVTGASFWMGYTKGIEDWTDEAAVREAKLAYIANSMASGALVAYEITPRRIVITCPAVLIMAPQYFNAVTYGTVQAGADKYGYDLGIRDEFFDQLIAYKAEWMADEANAKAMEEYYAGPMFQMLDGALADAGMETTNLQLAQNPNSVAGFKTQTSWIPAE